MEAGFSFYSFVRVLNDRFFKQGFIQQGFIKAVEFLPVPKFHRIESKSKRVKLRSAPKDRKAGRPPVYPAEAPLILFQTTWQYARYYPRPFHCPNKNLLWINRFAAVISIFQVIFCGVLAQRPFIAFDFHSLFRLLQ